MTDELDLLIRARCPLLWLRTSEEVRAIERVCRTAARLGDPVTGWCLTYGLHDLPGPPRDGSHRDPTEALRFLMREERRGVFVLRDLGPLVERNASLVRLLKDAAHAAREQGNVLVCVGNNHPLPRELEAEAVVHRLPLPELDEHLTLLRRITDEIRVVPAPAAAQVLATACLGLTLDQAENTWARLHAQGARFGAEDVAAVLAEKARLVRESGLLDIVPPRPISEVGGLDGLKRWIRQRQVAFAPEARSIGLPFPRGMLLVGVQGCGKSLVARAVAGLWGQPLVRLDVGRLMAGYVGESETNLESALEFAERTAPCVLWIDEIEKAFAGYGSTNDGGVVTRMLGAMLTWMQERERPVFVLATANSIDHLPPEMLRKGRFDEIFFVDLPDPTQRADIWRIHLEARARAASDPALTERVDLQALAQLSEGYSGAEIAAAVVEGAFAALTAREALDGRHLQTALAQSPPLSRTRAESIEALRGWAEGRARSAS